MLATGYLAVTRATEHETDRAAQKEICSRRRSADRAVGQ